MMSAINEYVQNRASEESLLRLFVSTNVKPEKAEELAEAADILPGTLPIAEDMRTKWKKIINVLDNQGKLRALIQKAAVDPEIAVYKKEFTEISIAMEIEEKLIGEVSASGLPHRKLKQIYKDSLPVGTDPEPVSNVKQIIQNLDSFQFLFPRNDCHVP